MIGDKQMIALPNGQLTDEPTAINPCFLHSRLFRHRGLERLAKTEYDASIGGMKHADPLIERILMLDGLPNLQSPHKVMVGESTTEILECGLKREQSEGHVDWLETQLELIRRIGLENDQQAMMGDTAG